MHRQLVLWRWAKMTHTHVQAWPEINFVDNPLSLAICDLKPSVWLWWWWHDAYLKFGKLLLWYVKVSFKNRDMLTGSQRKERNDPRRVFIHKDLVVYLTDIQQLYNLWLMKLCLVDGSFIEDEQRWQIYWYMWPGWPEINFVGNIPCIWQLELREQAT